MSDERTILVVDADLLVYRFSWIAESTYKWNDDLYTKVAHMDIAKRELHSFLDQLREKLDADDLTLVLSDQGETWRRDVLPDYKSHRPGWRKYGDWSAKGTPERPMLFGPLREYMQEELGAVLWPRLEGDDVLGITMTRSPNVIGCSIDKDMQTIPGRHFNWDRPDDGVVTVGLVEAERNHLLQTLMGDTSDGYKGVPRVGPVKAKKILDPYFPPDTPPEMMDPDGAWEAVLAAYRTAGIESMALRTAQVARILRDGEYDVKTKEVKLWTPTS